MKSHLKTIVGFALSILLLWWALRDVSPAHVLEELRRADPLLFSLAILTTVVGFAIRAVRWGVLLRPVAPHLPFRSLWAATNIGFAANNLLPARVGELARALSLSRLTPVTASAAIASLVIERLLDGLVLVALLFIAMASPAFPTGGGVGGLDPRTVAGVVAVVMAGIGAVLFALVVAPERSVGIVDAIAQRILPTRFRRPLLDAVHSFIGGLGVLRSGHLFLISLAWAVGQWVFLAVSYLLALRAFGIDDVPFSGAVFLQSLIALAVAVPSSPGFFGPFEAAAKLGLGLWGVAPSKAVSFAIGFHIGGFIPVTVIGIYYVWRLGLNWREVQHSADEVAEEDASAAERHSDPVREGA